MKYYHIVLSVLTVLLYTKQSHAGDAVYYKEINIIGAYSSNEAFEARKAGTQNSSVGFEFLKKFSSDYGDFLTVDIQARLTYDPFDRFNSAWTVELHNAWLEYKLALGSSIRAGHFDPAFGLEPVVDTHGTLFQTLAKENIGFKKDWGAAYRGTIGDFDYEIAGQLGSGMGVERKDGSFLITGRIGNDRGPLKYGASFLYGQVLKADGAQTFPRPGYAEDATEKKRIGLDAQYEQGSYLFKGEVVFGQNERDEAMGFLGEMDYTLPNLQALTLKTQFSYWQNDLNYSDSIKSTLAAGLSYRLTQDISIRLAYFHDLDNYTEDPDRQVVAQVYYYGF